MLAGSSYSKGHGSLTAGLVNLLCSDSLIIHYILYFFLILFFQTLCFLFFTLTTNKNGLLLSSKLRGYLIKPILGENQILISISTPLFQISQSWSWYSLKVWKTSYNWVCCVSEAWLIIYHYIALVILDTETNKREYKTVN